MNDPGPLVLKLPSDDTLRKRLQAKLIEYQNRKSGKGRQWEYAHHTYAFEYFSGYRDAFYKVEVLTAVLLAEEPVNTYDLSIELVKKQGDKFNIEDFTNACVTINHYLTDPDQKDFFVQEGTGLPTLPVEK